MLTVVLPSACPQERIGLAAEHGWYWRPPGAAEWLVQDPEATFDWKGIVHPILQVGGALGGQAGRVGWQGGGGCGGLLLTAGAAGAGQTEGCY